MGYNQKMRYFSELKGNDLSKYATMWMELKSITATERNQSKKASSR